MKVEVKGCGCRYRKKDIAEDVKSITAVDVMIADYLCPQHTEAFILESYNHKIIAAKIYELDRKRMMVS